MSDDEEEEQLSQLSSVLWGDEEEQASDEEESQPLSKKKKKTRRGKRKKSLKKNKNNEQRRYYSLWLKDRTRGRSHPDLDNKPPVFCCYVPAPVHRFSRLLEQNVVCEATGRIGCCVDHNDSKTRARVLSFGLFANIMALWITFYACFAISKSFEIIRATAFSKGQVLIMEESRVFAKIDIGLTAVAFENFVDFPPFHEPGEHVIEFDQFCDLVGDGLEYYMDPAQCQSCANASTGLVKTIIFSVISVLPNLMTDFLRMYPNYDVNCQKFFGTIISIVSMCLSLLTYIKYNRDCFSSFYQGTVPFYLNKTVVTQQLLGDDDTPIVEADFAWYAGPGVICMFVATSLKIIDIIAMLIVPTPEMTRDHKLQEEYERLYNETDGAGFVKEGEEDVFEDEEVEMTEQQRSSISRSMRKSKKKSKRASSSRRSSRMSEQQPSDDEESYSRR